MGKRNRMATWISNLKFLPPDLHVRITKRGQALINNPILANKVLDAIQKERGGEDWKLGEPKEFKDNGNIVKVKIVGQVQDVDRKL